MTDPGPARSARPVHASSFLKYAVDMDAMAIATSGAASRCPASIADYLQQHDWDAMKRWGYEVRPAGEFRFAAITAHEGQPVAAWEKLRHRRGRRQPIADGPRPGCSLPAGAKGPAF